MTTEAIRRAKLQSNRHRQQTNTQPFYRPDDLPVAQLTVTKRDRHTSTKTVLDTDTLQEPLHELQVISRYMAISGLHR